MLGNAHRMGSHRCKKRDFKSCLLHVRAAGRTCSSFIASTIDSRPRPVRMLTIQSVVKPTFTSEMESASAQGDYPGLIWSTLVSLVSLSGLVNRPWRSNRLRYGQAMDLPLSLTAYARSLIAWLTTIVPISLSFIASPCGSCYTTGALWQTV